MARKKAAKPLEIVLSEEQLAGIIEEAARARRVDVAPATPYPSGGMGTTTSFPGLSTGDLDEIAQGYTPIQEQELPGGPVPRRAVREEIRESFRAVVEAVSEEEAADHRRKALRQIRG
jgi:hypothetical protein